MTGRRLHRGRIVIAGAGGVSQCLAWLLGELIDMDWSNFTVCDQRPTVLPAWLTGRGAQFEQVAFTRDRARAQVAELAGPGDLFIDLTTAGTPDMAEAAWRAGAAYLNASATEEWDGDPAPSLWHAWQRLADRITGLGEGGPPVVVDCGMNPGGISHMFFAALADRTEWLLAEGRLGGTAAAKAQQLLDAGAWAELRELTGAWVFQCTEVDDQETAVPRAAGEFTSTWSAEAMFGEAAANAEVGWGAIETGLPPGAVVNGTTADLGRPAGEMRIHGATLSWAGTGVPIAHGEEVTLTSYFEGVSYNYCYHVCPATWESVEESRAAGWAEPARLRVLKASEITRGADEIMACIWGGPAGWCCGTRLGIGQTRRLAPGIEEVTPTLLQVAAFLAATAGEILDGRVKGGLRRPENLDSKRILTAARPWLGDILSGPSGWSPPGAQAGDAGWRRYRLSEFLA